MLHAPDYLLQASPNPSPALLYPNPNSTLTLTVLHAHDPLLQLQSQQHRAPAAYSPRPAAYSPRSAAYPPQVHSQQQLINLLDLAIYVRSVPFFILVLLYLEHQPEP